MYPGQTRSLGAMQTMALQMRKLQKKQKTTAKELQAASAREAFWKDAAHSTEQALDEVTLLNRAGYHSIAVFV